MAVAQALIPVFLVIALGALLKRTLVKESRVWEGLERLTFYVLFPALLVTTTATADLARVPVAGIALPLMASILLVSALLLVARPSLERALALRGPAFTSVFQGATRWNTYVALAMAGALLGADGIAQASVAIVAMVPLLNVVNVLVLARYAAERRPDGRTMLVQVLRNPLIWSCVFGMVLNFSGLPLPRIAVTFGEILGRGSLAIGLLVVGAGIVLEELHKPSAPVALAGVLKLFLMPALAIAIGYGLGLAGSALTVVAIASSVPSAPGSYVLARQMGGDAPLLARILTIQTVAALATMPLALAAATRFAP
jgi:predicted permease